MLNSVLFLFTLTSSIDGKQQSSGKVSGQKRNRADSISIDSTSKRVKFEEENKVEGSRLFTEEALSNLKIYNELKTIYEEECVNQITHQFLNRISQQKMVETPHLNKFPLMQYLSNAWKIMMMTEFEISTWAVYLDDCVLDESASFTVEDYILNTAFYIKMMLNDEAYLEPMFNSYFNWYIHSFITKFNDWMKVK